MKSPRPCGAQLLWTLYSARFDRKKLYEICQSPEGIFPFPQIFSLQAIKIIFFLCRKALVSESFSCGKSFLTVYTTSTTMLRCASRRSSLPLTKSLSLLQRQECRLLNECRLRYLDLQRLNENVCQFFLQVTSCCRSRSSLPLTNKI